MERVLLEPLEDVPLEIAGEEWLVGLRRTGWRVLLAVMAVVLVVPPAEASGGGERSEPEFSSTAPAALDDVGYSPAEPPLLEPTEFSAETTVDDDCQSPDATDVEEASAVICVSIDQESALSPPSEMLDAPVAQGDVVASAAFEDPDPKEYCLTHPFQWYTYRQRGCYFGGINVVLTNTNTGAVTGGVYYYVLHQMELVNGTMHWYQDVTLARQSFWGTGALAQHKLDLDCDGQCDETGSDIITPPWAGGENTRWYFQSTASGSNAVGTGNTRATFTFTAPGHTTGLVVQNSSPIRCDNLSTFTSPGCVFPHHAPTATWDYNDPDFWEVPRHIRHAQDTLGLPGKPGTRPLHRLTDEAKKDRNRNTACPRSFPTMPGQSCDEYPFASTWEGASTGSGAFCGLGTQPGGHSARAVNANHNSGHGNGSASVYYRSLNYFYDSKRLVDCDAFWVQIIGQQRPASTQPAVSWNNMFDRYGDGSGKWNGGDGAQSTPLPGGSTAWFFNDSYWGAVASDGTRRLFSNSTPRNMVVVQHADNSLSSIGGRPDPYLNPLNLPGTLVAGPGMYSDQSRYHLVGGDAVVEGNTVTKFYPIHDAKHVEGNDAFPSWPVNNAVASFNWTGTSLNLTSTRQLGIPWAGIQWGISVLQNEPDYYYVYGVEDIPYWKNGAVNPDYAKWLHLARVPKGRITSWSEWRFWTGTGWSSNQGASKRMMRWASDGFSVTRQNGKYVLVTADSAFGTDWSAVARYADAPEGFSDSSPRWPLFTPPARRGHIYYEYRVHPQFSRGGRVLISYTPNTIRVDKACMTENFYDARIYRPRFLEVVLPDLGGADGPLPTTGAPAPAPYPDGPPVLLDDDDWHVIEDPNDSYYATHCSYDVPAPAPSPYLSAWSPYSEEDARITLAWTMPVNAMWVYNTQYRDNDSDGSDDPNCDPSNFPGQDLQGWCQLPYPTTDPGQVTMRYLKHGHSYSFRVFAGPWRSSGQTASNVVTVTARTSPPTGRPQNVTAVPGNGSVTVSWTDDNPNVWFKVYARNEETGEVIASYPFAGHSLYWDDLPPVMHTFWVVENNIAGDGPPSATVQAKPFVDDPCRPPGPC